MSSMLRAAITAHQAGDLARARPLYEAVLRQAPAPREALHYLGLLHFQEGRPLQALLLMEQARTRGSRQAAWLEQLGEVYRALKRYGEAEACFRRALALEPGSVPARGNLGLTLEAQGRLAEARAVYEALLARAPDSPQARVNLGVVLAALGEHEGALAQYRRALELAPDHAEAHLNLAAELVRRGEPEAALPHFDFALQVKPGDADAWVAAGQCLRVLGRHAAARRLFQEALARDPEHEEAHAGLAQSLSADSRYEEAAAVARAGLEQRPASPMLLTALGTALADAWRVTEGLQVLERAVRLFSQEAAWTSLLLYLHYVARDAETLRRAHARFARCLLPPPEQRFPARRHGRLRIGYVSADFNAHAVAFFLHPLLAAHDRSRFEVYCYSASFSEDEVTAALKAQAEHWRRIAGRSAEVAARMVEEDEIDILVDLSGHTGDNRLDVFLRRAAPVQVTYLGYPDTTALPRMDYRITDAWTDPPGMTEALHSEDLVRLPSGFLCYEAPRDAPDVVPPPCGVRNGVSFGSFNNLNKVTPKMIALWCRILQQVPGSRLILKSSKGWEGQSGMQARLLATFAAHGMPEERVVLLERTDTVNAHLACYGEVDIALDTYPYHGTTTTFEALYMGVPVITIAGRWHCARVGVSILTRVGHPEWIAEDADDYVKKAVALAADPARLTALRAGFRETLRAAGVMDRTRFTREMEAAFLDMWARYERAGLRKPVLLPIEEDGAPPRRFELADGSAVWAPDDLLLMTPYVLLEQEDWFEDEIRFVRQALGPGMRALDIGANYGTYTVAMARAVGPAGRVWAVEPVARTSRYLRQTLEQQGLAWVRVVQAALADVDGSAAMETGPNAELNRLADAGAEQVAVRRLDTLWQEEELGDLDFIKMDAEGQESNIITGGRLCLGQTSPLIMFEVVHGKERNLGLVAQLRKLGYETYCLVPGLTLLAPWNEREAESGQLNLFCCKRDRAQALAAAGYLVLPGKRGTAPARAGHALAWLSRQAFAQACGATGPAGCLPGGDLAIRALDDFVLALDQALPPADRLVALERAVSGQEQALQAHATPARLSTYARLLRASGQREKARTMAEDALARLEAGVEVGTVEPFLPATESFDAIPADRPSWFAAMLLTAIEAWRHYSSYFTPNESYTTIKKLAALGWLTPAMERRRQLIRLRFGLQSTPEGNEQLGTSRNGEFWVGKASQETPSQ